MLLDEPLRAGLVDWPRLLEVLDRLRAPVLGEPRINLLPDPADALREAERDRQHLAVPARDHRVRVGDRGHVDHAVLPDLLDLPRTSADDEVQALARLDHHELLAEDADLPLRREVHNRVAALVADRREVLEVVAAALRRDTDLVTLLADHSEMTHELGDPFGLPVFELAVRLRRPNRREDGRPWGRSSLVECCADDLVGQDVEGKAMDVQRLEVLVPCRLNRRKGFDRIVDETARTSPREVRSSLWPDRPTRWMRDVTCRGELYWTTWSTVPMSIPSSRVDVDTSPLMSPPLNPASTRSRSSRGREP